MKRRRKAETLVEILIAILIFGIIMGGVSDFISNHTMQIARIKTRDKMLAQVPKAMAYYYSADKFPAPVSLDGVSFDFTDKSKKDTLHITYGTTSFDFSLK